MIVIGITLVATLDSPRCAPPSSRKPSRAIFLAPANVSPLRTVWHSRTSTHTPIMPAYIIADVKVRDTEQYKAYVALSPAAVAAAGGKFIVRGGRTAVLEGSWVPSRIVVIEFDAFDDAQAFYDSVQYRDARAKRAGATDFFNMILVEGAA